MQVKWERMKKHGKNGCENTLRRLPDYRNMWYVFLVFSGHIFLFESDLILNIFRYNLKGDLLEILEM